MCPNRLLIRGSLVQVQQGEQALKAGRKTGFFIYDLLQTPAILFSNRLCERHVYKLFCRYPSSYAIAEIHCQNFPTQNWEYNRHH